MNKLLVVVDYQNDFVDGALGFSKAKTLDEGIAQLVQHYLAAGDPVVFTYDTHGAEYLSSREGKALPVRHCDPDTPGWQLYGKTQAQYCDTCATKQIFQIRKAGFGMAPQDAMKLAEALGNIREILFVGVVTNMCVISNAILLQAQWPDAQVTVDASLCASFNDQLHEKALDVMEGLQMQVINREADQKPNP